MILLLIMADDFTGALDTGVQFAARGIKTRVLVEPVGDLSDCDAQVLVVDTETRHLPPETARQIILDLTRTARALGVRYLYKKTDSALRGNIGAELCAILEGSGCKRLAFLPAFPQIGRVTRKGIHYIDGVPVTESPFGIDPFEPVRHAQITELIGEQANVSATSFPALKEQDAVPDTDGILVFDAESAEDLTRTGKRLMENGGLTVMAGCAGFAAALPDLLGLSQTGGTPLPHLDPRLLVVCGSVNPITLTQMDRAEEKGFSRLRLTPAQKLTPDYWKSTDGAKDLASIEEMLSKNPHCIIESNDFGGNQPTADFASSLGLTLDELRVRIAQGLGNLVKELFTSSALGTLLLTGGDTLLQAMNCVGVRELEPVCELEKGIVLARFTYQGCTRHVITKSGGFGQENLLNDLAERISAC